MDSSMDIHDKENILGDITSVVNNVQNKCRKRMKDGTVKEYSYTRKSRKTIDLVFDSDSEKLKFEVTFEEMKRKMKVRTNTECLQKLVEFYNKQQKEEYISPKKDTSNPNESDSCLIDTETDELFISSKCQLVELIQMINNVGPLQPVSFSRSGHVGQLVLKCDLKKCFLTWNSSVGLHNDFRTNYKVVHSYLCSGMLPTQYEKFCKFLDLGITKKDFRLKSFPTYHQVVSAEKEKSMKQATLEEKAETKNTENATGLRIMTDARHGCRSNSINSDVLALGINSHKIVGHCHVTKSDERSSQKHELYGTKKLYDQFETSEIQILEHAHDRNMSVSKFLEENHPDVQDSYDSWHSAKEVRKHMAKITKGTRKTMGQSWHPQLADKAAGVKTHVYWAMKNCAGRADNIKAAIDNIPRHYQNIHRNCHATSRCQLPGYIPSRIIITSQEAVDILTRTLRGLFIYKRPEKYITCRDTHYVESCNNTFLIYVDKRIHFKSPMYDLRTSLAVMDWNEHVDRPYTSVSTPVRAVNPRRRAPKKILIDKTFNFVNDLWDSYSTALQNRNVENDNVDGSLEDLDLESDNED